MNVFGNARYIQAGAAIFHAFNCTQSFPGRPLTEHTSHWGARNHFKETSPDISVLGIKA